MFSNTVKVRSEAEKKHKDSYWIGRCGCKGCKTVVRVTIPMIGTVWTKRTVYYNAGTGVRENGPEYQSTEWSAQGVAYDLGLHCTAHRRRLQFECVNGKYSEAHVCDARCINAVGHNCECSCGGKNHGAGHSGESRFLFKIQGLEAK